MRNSLLIFVVSFLLLASCQSRPSVAEDEHLSRGNTLFDQGDFDGAIAEFDQAIALNPNQPFY
jgi:tetratricopeptide (TPR) repeat protein